MLSRKYRLPSSVVLKNARLIRSIYFNAKTQSNNLSYDRYGFVVAKSVDKRAVVRNRIKRVARSVVEKEVGKNLAGHDILFICKPIAALTEDSALRKDVEIILGKIR